MPNKFIARVISKKGDFAADVSTINSKSIF